MQIDQLKYIIQNQRQQLAGLYEWKAMMKESKQQFDEEGDVDSEYAAHNEIARTSKQIARLVEIQKSLKADVRRMLERGRHMAGIKRRGAARRATVAEK